MRLLLKKMRFLPVVSQTLVLGDLEGHRGLGGPSAALAGVCGGMEMRSEGTSLGGRSE